jgi:hypothetical protein
LSRAAVVVRHRAFRFAAAAAAAQVVFNCLRLRHLQLACMRYRLVQVEQEVL